MMAVRRPAHKPSQKGVDEHLLVQAAQGNSAKFDVLYELYFHRVYYFLPARVRDRAAVEDHASEVFHKVPTNLPNYQWRALRRLALPHRLQRLADQYKCSSREHSSPDDPSEVSAHPYLSSRDLQAFYQQVQLFGLVNKLRAVQRRVIYERFVDQRNIREIAARLKKSE